MEDTLVGFKVAKLAKEKGFKVRWLSSVLLDLLIMSIV